MKILITYFKSYWTPRTLVYVRMVPSDFKYSPHTAPPNNPALRGLPSAVCFHDTQPGAEWDERNAIAHCRSHGREPAAKVEYTNKPENPEIHY